jgi:hypothetical protein
MGDHYPKHGPRRRWFAPWRVICRCGLDAYPCIVMKTVHRDRLNAAKHWRNDERRNARR